jgi:hypothetical protein
MVEEAALPVLKREMDKGKKGRVTSLQLFLNILTPLILF